MNSIDFNERNAAEVMPYFGQEFLKQAGRPVIHRSRLPADQSGTAPPGAGRGNRQGAEGLSSTPSSRPPKVPPRSSSTRSSATTSCRAVAPQRRPLPVTRIFSVPAGYVHGLPVGLSFFAGAFQEPWLIAYAYAFGTSDEDPAATEFVPSLI